MLWTAQKFDERNQSSQKKFTNLAMFEQSCQLLAIIGQNSALESLHTYRKHLILTFNANIYEERSVLSIFDKCSYLHQQFWQGRMWHTLNLPETVRSASVDVWPILYISFFIIEVSRRKCSNSKNMVILKYFQPLWSVSQQF